MMTVDKDVYAFEHIKTRIYRSIKVINMYRVASECWENNRYICAGGSGNIEFRE